MATFKNPVSIVKRAGGTAIVGEGTDYTLDTQANQPLNLTPMGDTYQSDSPAPTPSSPQAISVVTGKQTIKATTQQLLAKNGLATPITDTSYWDVPSNLAQTNTTADGYATFTSSSGEGNRSIFLKAAAVPTLAVNKTYTLVYEVKAVVGTVGLTFCQPGQTADSFSEQTIIRTEPGATASTGTNGWWNPLVPGTYIAVVKTKSTLATNAVRQYINDLGTSDSVTLRLSVYEGDVSKQIFPFDLKKNKVDGAYSNIVYWARSTGSAYGNGFTITSNQSSGATYAVLPIPDVGELLGKEVTVSCVNEGTGTLVRVYYLDGIWATSQIADLSGSGGTFTMPASISAGNDGIGICFYTSNNASASYTNIQLEVGSTATSYTPIIELCKFGDYQDYLWTDGVKWYKHKEIEKYVLPSGVDFMGIDGSSSSASTASTQGTFSILRSTSVPIETYNAFLKNARLSSMAIYSNTSVSGNTGAVNLPDGTFTQRSGTNDRIYYKNTSLIGKTGTECGALFARSVWYSFLDTTTEEEISDSVLVSDLNDMKAALSYSPTTSISSATTGSDLPVIVGSAVITGV